MSKQTDTLQRFLIDSANVRGELLHLDESWRRVLACADYPDTVQQVLGEAMAATALMSATIKFSGKLTLQVRGGGPVTMLVMQATADGALRGLAQWSDVPTATDLQGLFGAGQMLISIDSGKGEQYQGVVALDGVYIADALGRYFENSEQLPTALYLFTSADRVAGLLLQKMPGAAADSDDWNRVQRLAETITADEILMLDAADLLHRLFHEERVRLFDSKSLRFECSCSRERTAAMVKSLGKAEVDDIIAELGMVEVNCEFCNSQYRFDAVDTEQLFLNSSGSAGSTSLH